MTAVPGLDEWWGYGRRAEHDTVMTSLMVAMPDGTELQCDLTRPARDDQPLDGPFPGLVVELTPYHLARELWNLEAAWFAARGYVCVVGNIRGTGDSGGTWQHAMSSQDGRDAAALVEWLAAQACCDGRVGQFGESYGGQTSYGSAVERPPSLRAIAPMQSPGNLYDDVIYPGGIKSTEGGTMDNWPPIAQLLSNERFTADDEFAANRAHPTFDDYWQDRALQGRIADIAVPVLAIGGWPDEFFRSGALSLIEEGRERTWAFYGPWVHLPPASFDDPPADGALPAGVLLAWFDRWVREDEGAPVPARPTFASFEGPADGGAGWRLLPSWDPDGRDASTWTLGADGTLADDAPDGSLVLEQPREPADDGGSLAFTSAPLDDPRVLVGWPVLRVEATLSAPEAHFYAELVDVAPDGTETRVNDGFLKASHRASHVDPEPVVPGERTAFSIRIRANHWRFGAGHRVRVRLSGASSGTLTPVPEPVTVELHAGRGATLRLPGFAAPDPD